MVVSPASPWYPLLDTIADAVNPLLALVALVLPVYPRPSERRMRIIAYLAATLLGVAGIYSVRAIDRHLVIWHRFGIEYSTHSAFAASVAVSMAAWRRRWIAGLLAVLAVYFTLMTVIGYHTVAGILTSSAMALLVTIPWQLAVRSQFHFSARS